MTIHLHVGDLPGDLDLGDLLAVDTETMGLNPHRDRLCVVQISAGDGDAHLVHFPTPDFAAPNLRRALNGKGLIFHYARFDLMMLIQNLDLDPGPVFCTKLASRLCRTNTDRHGLRDLCRDLIGVEVSKEQQTSDWGAPSLTPEQQAYAANDVLHLHALKEKLEHLLSRENRAELADNCFKFLPTRARLDLAGWLDQDIFAHS
ncbi:ribonuclease D [Roseospirillum parvum]|uniref:Ribonuclease D n=1 Tax=Roseospirillum parvum TaxID=83401 RepID=A0A1G7XM75_9PROT|nr:ribonuclease D [Roseospirillum parvum]SDG85153.1 ribonuclease D [Roseospirillum parvum]